jgi:hypothetical protein
VCLLQHCAATSATLITENTALLLLCVAEVCLLQHCAATSATLITENTASSIIVCCRGVFAATLRSNKCDADHRKHRSSIVALVRLRGNMFTDPLPNNELMSQ